MAQIIKTTGFNYYCIGTITFLDNGKEIELSTIRSNDRHLQLTPEAVQLNEELVSLLNCMGDEDEHTAEEELEFMNELLAEGEYKQISYELAYAATDDMSLAELCELI